MRRALLRRSNRVRRENDCDPRAITTSGQKTDDSLCNNVRPEKRV